MHHKKFVLCAAAGLMALAIACSKSPNTPAAPSSASDPSTGAAPDGSTLKVTAPTPVSPINSQQPETVVLTANKATGKFDSSVSPSYEFQIRLGNNAVTGCTATVPGGSGGSVSWTPTAACNMEFDTAHTWRIRAVMDGAAGPWSTDGAFRSPIGFYINGNEVRDPLTNGRTAGI